VKGLFNLAPSLLNFVLPFTFNSKEIVGDVQGREQRDVQRGNRLGFLLNVEELFIDEIGHPLDVFFVGFALELKLLIQQSDFEGLLHILKLMMTRPIRSVKAFAPIFAHSAGTEVAPKAGAADSIGLPWKSESNPT
jgi:hypothetical protein